MTNLPNSVLTARPRIAAADLRAELAAFERQAEFNVYSPLVRLLTGIVAMLEQIEAEARRR